MLSLNYFWFIIIASFFGEFIRQYAGSNKCGTNPLFKSLTLIVSPLCMLANFVFYVLGFWFMPHWWYPLIFMGINWLLLFVQAMLSEEISIVLTILGLAVAPTFTVLSYLGLFGVI